MEIKESCSYELPNHKTLHYSWFEIWYFTSLYFGCRKGRQTTAQLESFGFIEYCLGQLISLLSQNLNGSVKIQKVTSRLQISAVESFYNFIVYAWFPQIIYNSERTIHSGQCRYT